ncbi:MAG: YkgJ family cysteine cluster protein [Actinomycetota bacterium]|nr:YkgJ family cysteine cluster protein [Actinomycetota bacterium]
MACKRCGACCSHMVLSFDLDDDWRDEKDWLLAHVGVALESEDAGEALVCFDLPCRHLIPAADGQPAGCRIHEKKPKVCREYPDEETLDYLEKHPWVTPDCGWRANGGS